MTVNGLLCCQIYGLNANVFQYPNCKMATANAEFSACAINYQWHVNEIQRLGVFVVVFFFFFFFIPPTP
jgi:hypothetical protein